MLICTIKASNIKFFAVLLVSVTALVLLAALVPTYGRAGEVAMINTDYSDMETNEKRVAFIKSFGYEINEQGYETETVIIPDKFDAVYTKYNDIQRAQGLNLKNYKGKTVTRYTYYVTNYPNYDGKVAFTMLVYRGDIIGGDVAGLDGAGFVHGFGID